MKTLTEYIAEKIAAAEEFGRKHNLHPDGGPDWERVWKIEHGAVVQAALKEGQPAYEGWEQDYPGLAFRLRKGSL